VNRSLSARVRASASTPSPFKMEAAAVGSVNQKKRRKVRVSCTPKLLRVISISRRFHKRQYFCVFGGLVSFFTAKQ
jgi:hypothetical protein